MHAFGLAAFFRFSIIWSVKGYRYDNLTVAGDFQEIITLQNGTGRNLRTAAIKGKSPTCRTYLEEMLAIWEIQQIFRCVSVEMHVW